MFSIKGQNCVQLVRSCVLCQRSFLSSTSLFSTQETRKTDVPVIKIPKRLEQKLAKIKRGQVKWQNRTFNAKPGKEIISAKRKEYSYYQNQVIDRLKPPKLTSHGWKHRRSVGDYFTIKPFRQCPALPAEDVPDGFEKFGLNTTLTKNLIEMNISNPTVVQQRAIPEVKNGGNILCASETGSGKTLAYLLPVLHNLMNIKKSHDILTQPSMPLGVVLVPSQELAEQVMSVAGIVTAGTGLTVQYLDGKKQVGSYQSAFSKPIDLIITTPGPLLASLRFKFVNFNMVMHFVVDEADTLLDESFQPGTLVALNRLQNLSQGTPEQDLDKGTQLVLVGATMPRRATDILKDLIPEESLKIISTPYLHRIMPHVSQKFLRIKADDHAVQLVEIVRRDHQHGSPCLIFCNKIKTCDWLSLFLAENGIPNQKLHGAMSPPERLGAFKAFQDGDFNFLVCTDIASRGVDTIRAEHVINFDFPNFMSDYIHRVGRVGRVASKASGHVTNFIIHKWDVDLVHKIEEAIRKRSDLDKVDANIKRKHRLRAEAEDDNMKINLL